MYIAYMYNTSHSSLSFSLSNQFPTTAFVYIHRNQSSNHSTVNKRPIGKNKRPELKSTILSCIHLTMLKLKSLLKPSCQPSCFFRSADPIPFLHEFYHGQLNFEMPLIHLKSQIFYPIPRQVKS